MPLPTNLERINSPERKEKERGVATRVVLMASRACVMSQSEEECPAATHESAEEIQQEKRLEYKTGEQDLCKMMAGRRCS